MKRAGRALLGRRHARQAAIAALLAGIVSGCSLPGGQVAPAATASAGPAATAALGGILAGSTAVEIKTNGDQLLAGRLFGDGPVGVVVAHGNRPDSAQSGMYRLAAALADGGYRVLTFNFRGFCPSNPAAGCSDGMAWTGGMHQDVEAAVAYVRQSGADTVFVVGSSLGGTATLYAAAQPDAQIAGVVAVSAPQMPGGGSGAPSVTPDVLAAIDVPKLFIVGGSDGTYTRDAEAMFEAATEPKQLEVFPDTSQHGEDLVGGFQRGLVEQTTDLILGFIADNA